MEIDIAMMHRIISDQNEEIITSGMITDHLPNHWLLATVREVFKFTKKPKALQYSKFDHIPFVPMDLLPTEHMFFDQFILKSNQELSSGTYFEPGDLLVAKITPSFENGKQGIIERLPTPFGIATTEVIPIKEVEGVSNKYFLFYYLLRRNIRSFLAGKMEGSTGRQRLSVTALASLEIPFPPLAEQRTIAQVLRTAQEAIQTRRQELELERERKAALMQHLFTYGTRGEPLKETEIGEMPQSWQTEELSEVADIVYGVQAAVAHLLDRSIGIPILTNINITNDGTLDISKLRYYDLPANKRERLLLRQGDLLFNWRSGSQEHVGKTALFDLEGEYTFSSFILRFRTKDKLNNAFLLYYLRYIKAQNYFSQNRQQSSVNSVFNASIAAKIPVVFPPNYEQEKIVDVLRVCDNKIAALEQETALLEELFHALLEEFMTGRLSTIPLIETESIQ